MVTNNKNYLKRTWKNGNISFKLYPISLNELIVYLYLEGRGLFGTYDLNNNGGINGI